MKANFIVMRRGKFLAHGGLSDEYPEARTFRSRELAKRAARELGKGSQVIRDYGLAKEEIVYES